MRSDWISDVIHTTVILHSGTWSMAQLFYLFTDSCSWLSYSRWSIAWFLQVRPFYTAMYFAFLSSPALWVMNMVWTCCLWKQCCLKWFVNVKPSCKSMSTTKKGLLRFTVFSFSIKIAIFKTLRRLDTTWNCRHGRQKVSIPECNLMGRLEEQVTITLLPVALRDRHSLSAMTAMCQRYSC